MRIPSEYTDNSLYRRGNRPRGASQTTRQLLRLVLGLVLVIVVMKQAAKPSMYAAFFGQPEREVVFQQLTPAAMPDQAATNVSNEAPDTDIEGCQLAETLTSNLSPVQQRQWLIALTKLGLGQPIESVPDSIDQVTAAIDADSSAHPGWQELLTAVAATDQQSLPDQSVLKLWLTSLDATATARVADGSIWQPEDFDAFYRQLVKSDALTVDGAVTIDVLPLLQQPDAYRGKKVRFAGRVVRAERVESAENSFDIEHYWQVWLRPQRRGERPLLLVTRHVPPVVAAVGPTETRSDGPPVIAVGTFLKRLAYRFGNSVEQTPVVIGGLAMLQPTPQPNATVSQQVDNRLFQRLGMTVLSAVVIGVGVSLLVMWRTGLAAKRLRKIRGGRKRPSEFLDALSDTPSASEITTHDGNRQ